MTNPEIQAMPSRTWRERINDSMIMAGIELQHANTAALATLAFAGAGLAFEWGPGNEALLGIIGANTQETLRETTNIADFIGKSVATGIITGSVSFGEQAAIGSACALSAHTFRDTFRQFGKDLFRPDTDVNKISTTLAIGASGLVIANNLTSSERTVQSDLKTVAKASAIVGAYSTTLVTGLSIGSRILDKAGASETSDTLIGAAKNPLTFLGIFASIKTVESVKKRFARRKQDQSQYFDT